MSQAKTSSANLSTLMFSQKFYLWTQQIEAEFGPSALSFPGVDDDGYLVVICRDRQTATKLWDNARSLEQKRIFPGISIFVVDPGKDKPRHFDRIRLNMKAT